jgi:hypothetical protein
MPGTQKITTMLRSGLLAMLACSVVSAYVVSLLDAPFWPVNAIGLTGSGVATSFFSFIFGAPVVLAYGIPVFSMLHSRGRATWGFVLLAALVPAILIAPFFWELAAIVAAFAVVVAVTIRWVHGRGPNNSFKPKPLRGSA